MQKMFESGVKKYVFVRVNYEFGFPVTFHDVAHVECAYCQMYDKYKNRCNITGLDFVEPTGYVVFEFSVEFVEEGRGELGQTVDGRETRCTAAAGTVAGNPERIKSPERAVQQLRKV